MKTRIKIDVPDDLAAEIDELADKLGISRDECVDVLLKRWLDENRAKVAAAKKVLS